MTWFMGIDIGSGTSKGIITENSRLSAHHWVPTGFNYLTAAETLQTELLAKAGLHPEDITRAMTTGHGSDIIPFRDDHIADMRCCVKGIHRIFPSARTVIDVQGQYSQVIQLDENGEVANFAISELCATGSGRFLEVIANVLQINIEDFGPLSLKSTNPITFTTGCAVFGESEAISRIAEGVPKEDILAGVHGALASKIISLLDRVGTQEPCAISGGGGLNIGLIKKIEELGFQLLIPSQPLLVNAFGAALIAGESDS
jgi:predicted CoA-substrate-specific enzyme activase